MAAFRFAERQLRVGNGLSRGCSASRHVHTVYLVVCASMGCILPLPATAVYEPNYEAGPKSTRYRIWLPREPAFGIAGLWRDWPDGAYSFTMLTVNADKRPVMNRMHAPGKEKRSVVIVPRAQWEEWLACRDPEAARTFMTLFPPEVMAAEPAPIVRRSKELPPSADAELPL